MKLARRAAQDSRDWRTWFGQRCQEKCCHGRVGHVVCAFDSGKSRDLYQTLYNRGMLVSRDAVPSRTCTLLYCQAARGVCGFFFWLVTQTSAMEVFEGVLAELWWSTNGREEERHVNIFCFAHGWSSSLLHVPAMMGWPQCVRRILLEGACCTQEVSMWCAPSVANWQRRARAGGLFNARVPRNMSGRVEIGTLVFRSLRQRVWCGPNNLALGQKCNNSWSARSRVHA